MAGPGGVKFQPTNNTFLNDLRNDVNRMKSDTKLFVPADKTSNFYKMEQKQYTDLLEKNITKSYKRSTDATARKIQREDKKITTKLGINDHVDITAKREAFNHPKRSQAELCK